MATKRTYGDRCGISRALDVVGERWALLVVRELLLGPKRFTDLRAGLPNLGPDVLSQRLRDLEAAGIVRRGTLPPPADTRVYELTPRGQELEPVVLALGAWGSRAPFPEGDARLGVDSAVLALKTLFDPAAAGSIDEEVELRLDGEPFRARVADGALDVARGAATNPLAVIETDPGTLSRVLWHGRNATAALRSGDLRIDGDAAVARRFLALFPAPETAAAEPAAPKPAAPKPAAPDAPAAARKPARRKPRARQSAA